MKRDEHMLRVLSNLERMVQPDDDTNAQNENVVQDLLSPIDETVVFTDSVEVTPCSPATFCWGNGSTIAAGWDWNGGGRWS